MQIINRNRPIFCIVDRIRLVPDGLGVGSATSRPATIHQVRNSRPFQRAVGTGTEPTDTATIPPSLRALVQRPWIQLRRSGAEIGPSGPTTNIPAAKTDHATQRGPRVQPSG